MQRPWTAEQWPNCLGWNVTAPNGKRFELWPSGSIVQLRKDDSITGYAGMRYCETRVKGVSDAPQAIALVQEALFSLQWLPCYDVCEQA